MGFISVTDDEESPGLKEVALEADDVNAENLFCMGATVCWKLKPVMAFGFSSNGLVLIPKGRDDSPSEETGGAFD